MKIEEEPLMLRAQRRSEKFYQYLLKKKLSLTPQVEKAFQKDFRLITKFMLESDVPLWYRGKSSYQVKAADNLLHAMRDDMEQSTAFRVRRCLFIFGLYPMVTDEKLKFLMNISRGNDLAFLWFLMELHYKTDEKNEYSVNEQIILSAIAHLDMVTTLRELDRILPPGNESRKALELRRRRKAEAERQLAAKQFRRPRKKTSFPYFDKLEEPPLQTPKSVSGRPPLKVSMVAYQHYLDPNYQPENELNRWFTNYQLKEGERVVITILRNFINGICTLLRAYDPNKSGTENEDSSIDVEEEVALEKIMEIKNCKVSCAKHRDISNDLGNEKLIRDIERKLKLLKKFDTLGAQKKRCLDRVLPNLKCVVNAYRSNYRKELEERTTAKSYVRVMGKDDCLCEFYISDSSDVNCAEELGESTCYAERHRLETKKRIQQLKDEAVQPHVYEHELARERDSDQLQTVLRKASLFSTGSQGKRLTYDKCLQEHDNDLSSINDRSRSSERYFDKPTANKPLKFNYRKIFKYIEKNDTKLFIKNCCVKALDGDLNEVKHLDDYTPNLLLMAEKCANDIWENEMAGWREHQTTTLEEEKQTTLPGHQYPENMPILDFYDCDDKELMESMLKIALLHMAKNPKFVLASLPESYKMPILREWIFQRYGKEYSYKTQCKLMRGTLKIINALDNAPGRIPVPQRTDVWPRSKLNPECGDYIKQKVKWARKNYQDRVKIALMEYSRIYWIAMSSHLCPGNTLHNTFFSYVPASIYELYVQHVWRQSEFRNNKFVWEIRQEQKSREQQISIT